MTVRITWLDTAKGLGICLVVVGHVLLLSKNSAARQGVGFIYLFHMPLFFVLAGMTLKAEPIKSFATRKVASLVLPYAFFLALLGLPALAHACGMGAGYPAFGIDACGPMSIKLLTGGSWLGGVFGTFWFIPCLFFALVCAQGVIWLSQKYVPALSGGAVIVLVLAAYFVPALVPTSTRLLSIGLIPMATLFVLAGFVVTRIRHGVATVWVLTGLVFLAWGFNLLAPFDMKHGVYGIPFIGALSAIVLSILFMQIAGALDRLRFTPLRALGASTLTVMFLHQCVHLGLRQLGVQNDVLLIVLALGIPWLLHPVLAQVLGSRRYRPRVELSTKSPLV